MLLTPPQRCCLVAATVLFSYGDVTIVNIHGAQPLQKGDAIHRSDTINTGANGRVQMRFSDGGLVSLRSDTQFVVEEYVQPGADGEGKIGFNLVKGGLRTLSGSIGHKNHENYQLKTPVATLGIRGTEYIASVSGDTMRAHLAHGRIVIANDWGSLELTEGQNGVAKLGEPPQYTLLVPRFSVTAGGHADDDDDDDDNETSSAAQAVKEAKDNHLTEPFYEDAAQGCEKNSSSCNEMLSANNPLLNNPSSSSGSNVDPNDPNDPSIDPNDPTIPDFDSGVVVSQKVFGFGDLGPDDPIFEVSELPDLPSHLEVDGALKEGDVWYGSYANKDPSNDWNYEYQAYAFAEANLPFNMPQGILNYELQAASSVFFMNNDGGFEANDYVLAAFTLEASFVPAADPSVVISAIVNDNAGTEVVNFESELTPVSVSNKGTFSIPYPGAQPDPSSNCVNCYLVMEGFFTSEAQQIGATYELVDNSSSRYYGAYGAVVLKKTP